jgi:hypothetical protein
MLNKVIFSTLTALLMTFAVLNTSVAGPVFGGGCGGVGKCGDNLDLLTEDEADDLKYMREEEKLAHDIYVMMAEKWGLIVFKNIAKSEEKHMAAVKHLLDKYNLTVPVPDEGYDFFNVELQADYDDFMIRGVISPDAALHVGAEIEEIDIIDLLEAINRTQSGHTDIIDTYESLMCGSSNHLRAFVRNIDLQGDPYEPVYLVGEELEVIFDAIMESSMDRDCGDSNGAGHRKGSHHGRVQVN